MERFKNFGIFILIFLLYLMLNMYTSSFFIRDIYSGNQVLVNLALIASNFITLIIFVFIYRKTIVKDLYKFNKKDFKTGFNYWITGIVLMILLNVVLSIIGGTLVGNEATNREIIKNYLPYAIFGMCIYAPVVEELVFRRALRPLFNNKYLYGLTSGFIFGSIHVFDEIANLLSTGVFTINLLYVLPYVGLGMFFAFSYYETDNIYSTITFHAIHNLIAIIFNILMNGGI